MKLSKKIICLLFFISTPSFSQSILNFGKPKVIEPCNVYFNGREFKLGSTKGDDSFRRLSYSPYGIETVVVSLPKLMDNDLNLTNKKIGDYVMPEGEFKKFMDDHWDQIVKLCKLKN